MVESPDPHMYMHVIHAQELTFICVILSIAICLTWTLRDLFQKVAAQERERKRLAPKKDDDDYPIFPAY